MTSPALDADRMLALSYVPTAHRRAMKALWDLDIALGAVLASGREPMISRIKLAWWRDALVTLDSGKAPAEPVLQAVAEHLLPRGISGAELALMEEGWTCLLTHEALSDAELDIYASARGRRLFLCSAILLGGVSDEAVAQAGEAWALTDLARHSANPIDADTAVAVALQRAEPKRWPAELRALGMISILARRDCEPDRSRWEMQGAPGRMLRMFRHWLTGR